MSLQILVVDDHEIVRRGIRRILQDSEFSVTAEAESAKQAQSQLKQNGFELMLLDVQLPDEDGFTLFQRVRQHWPVTTVFFADHDNPTHVARAASLGASGLVLKSATRELLLNSIRAAVSGNNTWCGEELRRVSTTSADTRMDGDLETPLTKREFEVLSKMCRGLTNKRIADEMTISYETVKEHVQHILRKIGVSDRTQAAVWAVRKGLVWPETEAFVPANV